MNHNTSIVRLGDYIEVCNERNYDLRYDASFIEGVNSDGVFCPTKAQTIDIDLKPYKIVRNGDFVYNPSRLNIGSLSYRETGLCIVSHLYVVFHLNSKGQQLINPYYLWIFFKRDQFRRLIEYSNYGSQRPEFNFYQMSDIESPVPSLDVQREVVEVWQGLRKMKEENEGLVEPLLALCRSYLQECKKKYPMKEIGPYLTPHDERNSELRIKLAQGVANTKVFQDPKQVSSNSRADKIVHPGQFAYNRATTRNGEKISIAYREGPDCTVSSAYQVFSISDESYLNPHYLLLWVSRPEFDRYARYMSKGSAHEFFEFEEMCRVKIPLPPIKVQRAIVDVYRCANESKWIAAEADRLSREICPALVRWAEEGGCK